MNLSLADKAYDLIKADIITCALQPGQQIAQNQMTERYGMGITPTREALHRLAREGFVEPIPRFGYIVTPITFSDVQEMFELRSILEASASRLAAIRGSDEQLKKLHEDSFFTYTYKDPESCKTFLEKNALFHRSIAILSGNSRLVELISRILDESTRVFHLGLDLKDSADEMRAEHIALTKALLDRDPDRAERIVLNQVDRSQKRVIAALIQKLGNTPVSELVQDHLLNSDLLSFEK